MGCGDRDLESWDAERVMSDEARRARAEARRARIVIRRTTLDGEEEMIETTPEERVALAFAARADRSSATFSSTSKKSSTSLFVTPPRQISDDQEGNGIDVRGGHTNPAGSMVDHAGSMVDHAGS